MRLLDTRTLQVVELNDPKPSYAILSHTWEEEEVSFEDVQKNRAEPRKGYTKIKSACNLAESHGFHYIWIDTCCIDKSSSAELSEAINSMYNWYREAQMCYAYLSDLRPPESGYDSILYPSEADKDTAKKIEGLISRCRWFRRGWTLQELIAPSTVLFYDRNWRNIGSKASLRASIFAATRIPYAVLLGYDETSVCVADKFKWAALRETTRKEDRAYSLMGLFGVNMPVLYGEGDQALIRLQQEIIKSSNDHSVFAWTLADHADNQSSLFSPEVDNFLNFSKLYGSVHERVAIVGVDSASYMTSSGLSCTLPYRRPTHAGTCGWALLDCAIVSKRPAEAHSQLLMGLDEHDDGHFLKNGRFIVTPEEKNWQATFKVKRLVIKHSASREVERLLTKSSPQAVIDVPDYVGPFRCLRVQYPGAQERFLLTKLLPIQRSAWRVGGQPIIEAWMFKHDGGRGMVGPNADTGVVIPGFVVVAGVGYGSPWCHIAEEQDYARFCEPANLRHSLLSTTQFSDRAWRLVGHHRISAMIRRGPRRGEGLWSGGGGGGGGNVYVVEMNASRLHQPLVVGQARTESADAALGGGTGSKFPAGQTRDAKSQQSKTRKPDLHGRRSTEP